MYLFQLIKERFAAGTPYNQPIGNCGKNTLKWKSALTVIGKKYKDLRRFNFCEKNLINSVTWITLNLLLPSQLPLDGPGLASCPRMIKQIEYSLNAIISNNLKLWNSSWGTSCSGEKRLIHSLLDSSQGIYIPYSSRSEVYWFINLSQTQCTDRACTLATINNTSKQDRSCVGSNLFLMLKPSSVPINLHRCWSRERKRSILTGAFTNKHLESHNHSS